MIRVFNVYLPHRTLFLAASEALLIFLALLGATFIGLDNGTSVVLGSENGLFKIALACGVCLLCMYYYDLYDSSAFTSPREVVTRLVQMLGTACVILALLYYAYPPLGLGANIFLIGIVLVGLCLAGWRRLFFALNRSPFLAERTVFVGDGPLASSLAAEIEKRPELGVRLVGYVGNGNDSGAAVNGLPRLGSLDGLAALVDPTHVRRVIVAMSDRRGSLPVQALLQLKTRGIVIQDGAEVYEAVTGKVPLDSVRPGWLVFSSGFRVSPAMQVYRYASNAVFSLLGLLLFSPLMALIAVAIKLDSRGPVFYRQPRVGLNGRIFHMLKFRSMQDDAESATGPVWAQKSDPRITRVGRLLRKLRLDELPQLINILRGDMNFVGPRPERPYFVEKLRELIPFYDVRHSVRPGITGWAQVCRSYGSSIAEAKEKLEYDLFYMKNISISLDVMILMQTAKVVLLGRGAQ